MTQTSLDTDIIKCNREERREGQHTHTHTLQAMIDRWARRDKRKIEFDKN